MKISKISDYYNGWYAGDFEPSCFKTKDFEACYKLHKKGEKWDRHFHKKATEINFLFSGKMIIQNQELNSGDVFVIYPNEVADPVFLEDCHVFIIKTPSAVNDKFLI